MIVARETVEPAGSPLPAICQDLHLSNERMTPGFYVLSDNRLLTKDRHPELDPEPLSLPKGRRKWGL